MNKFNEEYEKIISWNNKVKYDIKKLERKVKFKKDWLIKPCGFCVYNGHVYKVGACADMQCGRDNMYIGFIKAGIEQK